MNKDFNNESVYTVNSIKIVEETIDGEVIIINLDKGHYFSLNGTGTIVWQCLRNGAIASEIISNLNSVFNETQDNIQTAVNNILSNLLDEDLIISTKINTTKEDINKIIKETGVYFNTEEFSEPVLEKYTDMEDLLLLDPIHDVDEQGWPNLPKNIN